MKSMQNKSATPASTPHFHCTGMHGLPLFRAAVILLLAFLGLRPRLNEYRVG